MLAGLQSGMPWFHSLRTGIQWQETSQTLGSHDERVVKLKDNVQSEREIGRSVLPVWFCCFEGTQASEARRKAAVQ